KPRARSSTSRKPRTVASSSSSFALDSASSQSTGLPSEIEPVRSSRGSSALMTHDLGELAQGALHAHARRVGARTMHHFGNLLVAELELHAEVQEELLFFRQLHARLLVALEQIDADESFERGEAGVCHAFRERHRPRPAGRPPNFVLDTIADR